MSTHGLYEYSLFYEQRALEVEGMGAWAGERARSREGEEVNECEGDRVTGVLGVRW